MGNVHGAETVYYSTPPRSTRQPKPPSRGGNLPKLEKPKATEKELSECLAVTDVDTLIEENTIAHHTDQFECTVTREDIGFGSQPELVLRRGQAFNVSLTFNREFSLEHDDMQILCTTGKRPEIYSDTHGRCELDESGNREVKSNEWGATLLKRDKNTALIRIHIACNCAIGYWKLRILTKSKLNKDEKVKILQWTCKDEMKILFNPWCEDDDVYMASEEQRQEYVLNDMGGLWRGSSYWPKPKPWTFGQFHDSVLDTSLYLIMKGFKENARFQMKSPVKVSRAIAKMVNCCDDDGILCGNWSGDYKGGKHPGSWSGSPEILQQYRQNKFGMVKYGQCWVFSGLCTTVCRAVGLPARSITNFSSAHDTNNNTVIEKIKKRNEKGVLEPCGGDSIWNYHLWNDCWMKRCDLKEYDSKYDGWQAIDSTPQETSGGTYVCGPAPLEAIKNGEVHIPYDTAFVFAEVNGEKVELEALPGNRFITLGVEEDAVGKRMSTKKCDGKPLSSGWFSNEENILDMYKYPEGSQENRKAVLKAGARANSVADFYKGKYEKEDVRFKLEHADELPLGKGVDVTLTAENISDNRRYLKHYCLSANAMKYNGDVGEEIKSEMHEVNEELEPKKVYRYTQHVSAKEYHDFIDETRTMCIQAFAEVEKSRTRPLQSWIKTHEVSFLEPELEIQMPETAKVNETFTALIKFRNPLQEELTNCTARYEARGLKPMTEDKLDNVPVGGHFEAKFQLTPKRKGKLGVTFMADTKQIWYLSGTGSVLIK